MKIKYLTLKFKILTNSMGTQISIFNLVNVRILLTVQKYTTPKT